MARTCSRCGRKIPWYRAISSDEICQSCREQEAADERRRAEERRTTLEKFLAPIAAGPISAATSYRRLADSHIENSYTDEESESAKVSAIRKLFDQIMIDGAIGMWQMMLAGNIGDVLGMTEKHTDDSGHTSIRWKDEDLYYFQAVALTNGGWKTLGELPQDVPSTNSKERLYWGCPADCYREKVTTEFQFESVGGEARITDRLSAERSSIRGHEVETGRQLSREDSGVAYATTDRVVFVGDRSSWSLAIPALIGIKEYADGLRLMTQEEDSEPFLTVSDTNCLALLIASIRRSMKEQSGNTEPLGYEGIPDFPADDPELEKLLERMKAEQGMTDEQARNARMMSLLGDDWKPHYRDLLNQNDSVS